MSKRVLLTGDRHCGSDKGLTPPEWQRTELQESLWRVYVDMIEQIKPIHVLIDNGDMINGKESRQGATGLITADRREQAIMAAKSVEVIDPGSIFLTRGTSYHSGTDEDWEDIVADRLGARIEDQLWIDVEGVVFDVKHFVPASSIPHGRFTGIARDWVWNLLWNEMGQQPRSDVLVRSHVHYFGYCGGASWLALTTPALQGLGSKYGSRIPSGTVDFGLVWFDVEDGEVINWDYEIILIELQKAKPIVVGG